MEQKDRHGSLLVASLLYGRHALSKPRAQVQSTKTAEVRQCIYFPDSKNAFGQEGEIEVRRMSIVAILFSAYQLVKSPHVPIARASGEQQSSRTQASIPKPWPGRAGLSSEALFHSRTVPGSYRLADSPLLCIARNQTHQGPITDRPSSRGQPQSTDTRPEDVWTQPRQS